MLFNVLIDLSPTLSSLEAGLKCDPVGLQNPIFLIREIDKECNETSS